MTGFRWNEWNIDHIAGHGVTPGEAEEVVRNARRPYPKDLGAGKWIVWGRGSGGRFLQVIFIIDPEETAYLIHSRPLNETEKRRYRRSKRDEF